MSTGNGTNILIVGAGAIGTALAVSLARGGAEVTLGVRPGRVPEGGALKVMLHNDANGAEQWAILPAVDRVAAEHDLVVLAVRSFDLVAAGEEWLQPIPPLVLVLGRGPGSEQQVSWHVPGLRLAGLAPDCVATLAAPGSVHITGPLVFAVTNQLAGAGFFYNQLVGADLPPPVV